MPNYMVFSLVDTESESVGELWKFRGTHLADTPREASMKIAEVDATENEPGTKTEYAACRSHEWVTSPVSFTVKPELDSENRLAMIPEPD